MREPDFDRLRSEVGDAVRQPDFFTVRRRARQVRRRRAVTSGAMFVATLLTATTIGYAASTGPADRGPVGSAPTAAGDDWPRMESVTGVGDELYLLLERCQDCGTHLYASADDGASWQSRTEPAVLADSAGRRSILSPAPGVVVWRDRVSVSEALGQTGPTASDQLWVTTDGGRTWRKAVVEAPPVAAAPAGSRVVTCEFLSLQTCVYAALNPTTGRITPLATQPTGVEIQARWPRTINAPMVGQMWVSGLDPATDKPAVATSPDGGRTWRTHVFTGEVTAVDDFDRAAGLLQPQVTAGPDGTAYVLTYRSKTEMDTHYTTDGGLTWHDGDTIRDARPDGTAVTADGTFVTADGAFITADGAHIVRTSTGLLARDSTGRYRPVTLPGYPEDPIQSAQLLSPRRYLAGTGNGLYFSEDGRNWWRVRLP